MAVTVQENVQHLLKWYHFLHLFPLAVVIPLKKKPINSSNDSTESCLYLYFQ